MSVEEFEVWFRRAESNLEIAHRARGERVFLEDLCFEAQQAAEKALKALLIYLSGDYPKVHAFTLLLERLEQHVAVPEPIREVVELSDYAVQVRYPGEYYPVSEEEYERALELAERVLRWVRSQTGQRKEGP
ncbi:MAG: HEPN domain-containing protein [Anaerolineae bacterium]|jgi:HEPN domain-containing protein|nr:HEPN domain-containing protein [Anaerolineae bacterium]